MADLRHPWAAVSAMFMLNGGLFGIWASRVPAFVDRFGMTESQLGIVLLCLAGGAVLSFPVCGALADRFGAAQVTRSLAVLYTVTLIGLALAPSVIWLAVALTAFGIMHGGMDVTMNSWAAEVERHMRRSVMSQFHAMFSLGAGLGAASGYVAARAGLSVGAHFGITGVVLMALALVVASREWSSLRSTAKGPVFAIPKGPLVLVGILAAASSIGEGGMADWSAVFLREVAGATEAQAALGYAVFSVSMVVTRFAGGAFVSALGPVRAVRISGASAFTGVVVAVIFPVLSVALPAFLLMGFGYAVLMPLVFSRAAAEPGIGAGRAIASVASLGYGGMLMGPPIIGFLAHGTSLRVAFLLLAVLAALIVALAPIVRPAR